MEILLKTQKIPFIFGFLFVVVMSIFVSPTLQARGTDSTKDEISRLDSLAKLTKIIGIVENYYVDDLKLSEIVDKSIAGLLTNLDAHSSFMDQKSYNETKIQTQGEFGGLGITVGMKDGALTVIAPIEGTPADKAGVKANDVILRIDGNATLGITLDEAVNKMRGEKGTPVSITIVRQGEPKPFDIDIIRDIIKVDSVYAKNVENEGILYLRVTNFDQKVTDEASKFIKKFESENNATKGIILDLRNNPGGLLDQAIGLTNLFVSKGTIVSQKGRDPKDDVVYDAKKDAKVTNLPLVVLINGGSASASEIVSGALQDLKRAVLIGENTFGKGSVQVILPIDQDGKEALRLTIAKYYLPSGRTIQAVGLKPDLIVHPGKVPQNEFSQFTLREADLKKHLEGELEKLNDNNATNLSKTISKNNAIDGNISDNNISKTLITSEDIQNDIQLKSAIDTIKILNLTK
ncbi:MAG: S41 family peptidase [Campylobacter sp.]|nr:S41 family peptidase [Campylobacter sp.]